MHKGLRIGLAVGVAVLGFLGAAAAARRPVGVPVAVTTQDIAAGAPVPASAVTTIVVPPSLATHNALAPASAVVGRALRVPLAAGSTVPRGIIGGAAVPRGEVALPLSVLPAQAAGVVAGERVAIFALPAGGAANGQPGALLATGVPVLEVAMPSSGGLLASSHGVVVVRVPLERAAALVGPQVVLAPDPGDTSQHWYTAAAPAPAGQAAGGAAARPAGKG
ncbi:MAG: SAF domain-containing protein [Firmicutes bacterium]|nr:SAF domain-containing protein [Bacillota bacterium]